MYLDHFGLSEAPFRITPHTEFFFAGANRGATLDALLYAITHDEGIVKVSGEVGSGKTMLCRVLMERLPQHVETIYMANPSLSRDEILLAISDELKLDPGSDRNTRVLRSIQDALIERFAAGRRVVVLIDEAHAMPRETLEEIRLLSNLESNRNKLLQIVLFGQPELDELLNTAEMRQLKERITHGFRLEPLVRNDIRSYIDYRMRAAGYRGPNPFTAGAIRRIDEASKGLTRRINILADKSLLAAFAANTHSIGEREAKRAVADSDFYRPKIKFDRVALRVALIGAGTAAGIAIGYGLAPMMTHPPAQNAAQPSLQQNLSTAAATGASVQAPVAAKDTPPAEAAAGTRDPESPANQENSAAPTKSSPPPAAGAETAAHNAKESARSRAKKDPTLPQGKVTAGLTDSNLSALGKRARQRFDATQEWLKDAPGKHYSIQLTTIPESEPARLENFLGRAEKLLPEAEFYIYSVKINGMQHYRVASGSYPSAEEVRKAMAELPPDLKAPNPYFRSIERMRSQNSQ
jgi:MSHA biogenesis protein MshM